MSKYTTGEVAKLCGVSVRTVQFYDSKGILVPAELSEGGRRLYAEEDLRKMKVICFLKELGFSLNKIALLMEEENVAEVISLLAGQQKQELEEEIRQRETMLERVNTLLRELKGRENLTMESIGDIAKIMEGKKKLRSLRIWMLCTGILAEAITIAAIVLGVKTGIWWPIFPAAVIEIGASVWISLRYFSSVDYICPHCHEVFRPALREAFWANHTPNTRKLRCPKCGVKSFCVETWGGK